jgi:hypothetical protein
MRLAEGRGETALWLFRCANAAARIREQGVGVVVKFLVATGYGGQILETLALPSADSAFERITGLSLNSYLTASFTYHFRRR